MNELNLLPCPFCGGVVNLEKAHQQRHEQFGIRQFWGVVCRNMINLGGTCAIEQVPSASPEAAAERWNRRAAPADVGEDGLRRQIIQDTNDTLREQSATMLAQRKKIQQLEHALRAGFDDLERIHAAVGLEGADVLDAEKVIAAIADLRAQLAARGQKREMAPEMKAALEEAHRTSAAVALLPNGSAVFINYGHDYGDNAHLECTACCGSGHIEDQQARATPQPAALQEQAEPEYELHQDDMMVAGTSGKDAWRAILHYAAQYEQDVPVEIYEVLRRKVSAQGDLQEKP